MNKFIAVLAALVVVALACALSLSAVGGAVSSTANSFADIEQAQAVQSVAHAAQYATIGGVIGQVLVLIAVAVGGVLVFAGIGLASRKRNLPAARRPALEDRVLIQYEEQPEELIFASWR